MCVDVPSACSFLKGAVTKWVKHRQEMKWMLSGFSETVQPWTVFWDSLVFIHMWNKNNCMAAVVTVTVEGVLSEVYPYCGLRLTGIMEDLIRFFILPFCKNFFLHSESPVLSLKSLNSEHSILSLLSPVHGQNYLSIAIVGEICLLQYWSISLPSGWVGINQNFTYPVELRFWFFLPLGFFFFFFPFIAQCLGYLCLNNENHLFGDLLCCQVSLW